MPCYHHHPQNYLEHHHVQHHHHHHNHHHCKVIIYDNSYGQLCLPSSMSPRIIITHSKDWNWQVRLSTKKTALSQKKVTIDFDVKEFNSFSSTSPGANLFGCKVGREQSSLSKKTDRVVRSTALDWHYLSHHVCFLVAFSIHREFGSINPTSVKCYHRLNENKWYLPPHPPH